MPVNRWLGASRAEISNVGNGAQVLDDEYLNNPDVSYAVIGIESGAARLSFDPDIGPDSDGVNPGSIMYSAGTVLRITHKTDMRNLKAVGVAGQIIIQCEYYGRG